MVKRLTREGRRRQLLDTAKSIVRDEGVDALSLGRLAERAGISKPVAYDHFDSRDTLLTDLYREIDEAQVDALRRALAERAGCLDEIARIIGDSYMACSLALGGEWHAIAAALQGSESMEKIQRELIDVYVSLVGDALAPFASARGDDLRLICVGLHGAAESIAREMALGRVSKSRAVAALATIINGSLR